MKIGKKLVKGAAAAAGVSAATLYGCYQKAFYVPKECSDPYHGLDREEYVPYKKKIDELIEVSRKIPYEDVYTASEDGLLLHARYYVSKVGAPVEIQCHGYRGNCYRDFCGGLQLALERGHNVLLIDQRAHGQSEGNCLSFGILERRDCRCWVNYINRRCGEETKIILVGISMGAATVMMATELNLPENVVGVVADCGYSSPEKIIRKVMKDMKIPQIFYPVVAASAKVYGHFDLSESTPTKAMSKCKIPVVFVHGEADEFVPYEMTLENYEACASKKALVSVPGAGHGLSYMVNLEAYRAGVDTFLDEIL